MNRNHQVLQESTRHVTRFIALSKVANAKKLKWLYAFNVVPMANLAQTKLVEQPAIVTVSPFTSKVQEHHQDDERKVIVSLPAFIYRD